ncbi:hypothetical protein Syun_016874 [Stephania yunnanensis]|uniref:Uncharacterized protein n=1 Tax=Stephania yunnanensis TaxID=152371 RepID=A0AAP0P1V6_9MAGN
MKCAAESGAKNTRNEVFTCNDQMSDNLHRVTCYAIGRIGDIKPSRLHVSLHGLSTTSQTVLSSNQTLTFGNKTTTSRHLAYSPQIRYLHVAFSALTNESPPHHQPPTPHHTRNLLLALASIKYSSGSALYGLPELQSTRAIPRYLPTCDMRHVLYAQQHIT